MEFSTICRVCMQPISLEYIDLDTPFNETTYFECFNFCTKLEAKVSDKLPKTICLSCANLLQMAYDFINAALEADRLFHECFAQLGDNVDVDIKFITEEDEDEIVSKEIIGVSTESVQNEKFEEIKPIIYEELTKEELEIHEQIEDYSKPIELSLIEQTEDHFVPELPIFEIIESIEVEKIEENEENTEQVKKTKNTKPQINRKGYRYILPKNGKGLKIDIDHEKEPESEPKPIVRCHICNKKVSKNYEDHINEHTGNKAYKCDKCDESFCTLRKLKQHKAQIHKKFRNSYFCIKCGEAFNTEVKLNTHRDNDHSDENSGLCLTCGYCFTEQNDLEKHVKDEHYSRKCPVQCTHCKKNYQLTTLPAHVRYAHSDVVIASENKEFVCMYCFENFEEPTLLEEHLIIHKGKVYYTCANCGEDFKGKKRFEKHKAAMHPVRKLIPKTRKCNKCDFTTTELRLLLKHKKTHYSLKAKPLPTYLCAYCPRTFNNIKQLNDHEDYSHGEQKTAHQCDLCDKKFHSKGILKTHKQSAHGKLRPFMCKFCPKAFKIKGQLLQHEKYHYGKKYNCPHCDKKFVQPCYLRVHLRTHTNELPFECHLCGKKFPIKVRLTYHLEKHEGIVRNCEYCSEKFANVAKLRIHRFQHIGYPYVCDYCKENHHKKESFIRHMRRHHSIIMTPADVEDNRLRNMTNFYRKTKVESEPDTEI